MPARLPAKRRHTWPSEAQPTRSSPKLQLLLCPPSAAATGWKAPAATLAAAADGVDERTVRVRYVLPPPPAGRDASEEATCGWVFADLTLVIIITVGLHHNFTSSKSNLQVCK